MKRLTKDERTGATAIALVALLICGGSMLFKHLEKRTHASPEMVKTIILVSDSLERGESASSEPKKMEDNKRKTHASKIKIKEKKDSSSSTNARRKGKGKNKEKKNKKNGAPSRDYLSEPL